MRHVPANLDAALGRGVTASPGSARFGESDDPTEPTAEHGSVRSGPSATQATLDSEA